MFAYTQVARNVCYELTFPITGYDFGFRFAILVAGFRGRSSGFQELYKSPVKMPTLHVFGDTDQVIPKGTK